MISLRINVQELKDKGFDVYTDVDLESNFFRFEIGLKREAKGCPLCDPEVVNMLAKKHNLDADTVQLLCEKATQVFEKVIITKQLFEDSV